MGTGGDGRPGHHDVVEIVLAVVVLLVPPLALTSALTAPVALAICRRHVVPTLVLWLVTLAQIVVWFVTANAHMDWADATGGQGDAFVGFGPILGALVTGVLATAMAVAPPRLASAPKG
jgi:hypothetical protein